MPRRRVLFIVPLLCRAGAETQLVVLVNRLSNESFDKHLLSYRPGDDLKDDIDLSEVSVHELQRKGRLDLDVARSIGRIIDEHEIDVVHCTLQNALLFGYLGTRYARREVKLVASIHTTKNASIKLDIADRFVYRPLLKRCDAVWFVSSNQASLWVQRMPFLADKAVTVHNGIDVQEFDPTGFKESGNVLRQSLGISAEEGVICSIAGFRSEKMHSVLVAAFAKILAGGSAAHLLLAGAGPLEESLRKQVEDLGLKNSVHFLGSLSDVRSLLAASDCKALVSAAETFSMAMLEAMAMQVPVITTSVGGAAEAIEDGVTGILLEPGDIDALAEAMRWILDDKKRRLRMGEEARRVVVDHFSVEEMVAGSATYLANL